MEFQHLECFVAVAEELHFGKGAEKLQMTPSPVSRAIKQLERELGGALFIRRYHSVALTDLGGELFPIARGILRERKRLLSEAKTSIAQSRRQIVRLGVSTLCPPLISEALVELLQEKIPEVEVAVELDAAIDLLSKVERGDLDIVLAQLPLGRKNLTSMTLAKSGVWVVMRRDDPLSAYETLQLDQLAGRVLTLGSPKVEPAAMEIMIANLKAHGVMDLVELEVFDHVKLAAKIRYQGGLALTLHPDTGGSARIFDDEAFCLVPLTDAGFKFSLGAVWRESSEAAEGFIADVVELMADNWDSPMYMP